LAGSAGTAAGRPSAPSRARSVRKEKGSAHAGRRRRGSGGHGRGGEVVAVGELLMDLSHWGQSRDAERRHRAAHPGLGPWVGARVASPRCPILRPSSCSVSGTTDTGQCRGWVSRAHDGAEDPPWNYGPGSGEGSRSLAMRRIVDTVWGWTYAIIESSRN
jgi:hypothetical protein